MCIAKRDFPQATGASELAQCEKTIASCLPLVISGLWQGR